MTAVFNVFKVVDHYSTTALQHYSTTELGVGNIVIFNVSITVIYIFMNRFHVTFT